MVRLNLINREEELDLLKKDWEHSSNSFVVVYGRRRIGKTRLIDEFLKDKNGVKYTADDTNKTVQIRELKNAIASYLNDEFLTKQNITDWTLLFSYLEKVLSKNIKFYLWIDEFSYLIKNDPSIASVLQKFIDNFLRESKIFFIISGSIFGLMKEKVLESTSPLYGRRTRDILLKQINFNDASKFLNMKFEDKLKVLLTTGGVPEYLIIASKYKDYNSFLEEFFKPNGYFYREPYFLLSQEFKEIRTYFSILNAIAYGFTKPTEIASFVGINGREIYPYLELLISYGFVKRETSLIGNKKRGIYLIDDVFFDFWFNLVHKNRENIERNVYKSDKKEINTFLGKRFEMFIRDNFHEVLKDYKKIGRWWHKDKEIDIVALNEEKKAILFGECKWKDKVNAEEVIAKLKEKAKFVDWNTEKRKEHYAIFARSFLKKINEFEGKKVYCFDLKDFERVLKINKSYKEI